LKLFNSFGIILNTLMVSQKDNKELIKEIAEYTIILRFVVVRINLMIQVSRIQGHEICIVLYARLDGDCLLY